jgi:hypothetical protein
VRGFYVKRYDLLYGKVAAGTATGREVNGLLSAYHRGYPLESLRTLLRSSDDHVIRNAIWLASELGKAGRPLLPEVSRLLHHTHPSVRYDAIDSVLTCATQDDGPVVAAVLACLSDEERSVQNKTVDFLARAGTDQICAALEHFEHTEPRSPHIPCLMVLLSGPDHDRLVALLDGGEPLQRLYGLAAAARFFSVMPELLRHACESPDSCIRELGLTNLEWRTEE